MKYLKPYQRFLSLNENIDYNVEWIEPTEEYFIQELDEFFRVIKYSKQPGAYLHPSNIKIMMKLIPTTLTKFAELVQEKAPDLLPTNLQKLSIKSKNNLIKILTNIKEDELVKTDAGMFSESLMKLIPICQELKKDPRCREEGLELFGMGEVVNWSEEEILQTGHMGKISSFDEYGIDDTSDPEQLLKQVETNPNLSGFLHNVQQFIKPGVKVLPMPFVVKFPSGHGDGKIYSLIGGHKRSSIAIQLGIPIKVWFIDLC
jgi:hypothetical protein